MHRSGAQTEEQKTRETWKPSYPGNASCIGHIRESCEHTKQEDYNTLMSIWFDRRIYQWQKVKHFYTFQGVVTYMSRVEAFATGIKTESSDQSPLGGLIKESR